MGNYKFACPVCTQRIAYDDNAVGRKIRCPNCRSVIEIPRPEGGGAAPASAPVRVGAPRPASAGGPPPVPVGGAAPPGRKPATAKGGGDANSQKSVGSRKPLLVGVGVLAGVLAVLGVLWVLFFRPVDETRVEAEEGVEGMEMAAEDPSMEAGMEVAEAEPMVVPPPEGRVDPVFLPDHPEVLVAIRVAGLLDAPVVQALLNAGGPGATAAFEGMKQEIGLSPEEIESVVLVASDLSDLMQAQSSPPPNPMGMGGGMPGMGGPMGVPSLTDRDVPLLAVIRTRADFSLSRVVMEGVRREVKRVQGRSYELITGPDQDPVAVFLADSRTVLLGTEENVRQAIERGPVRGALPAAVSLAPEAAQVIVATIPSAETLEKMRTADPAAGGMTPGMTGGPFAPLATVLKDSLVGNVLSIEAAEGLSIRSLLVCEDGPSAEKLAAMFKAMLPQVYTMASGFTGQMPQQIRPAVERTLKSLASRQVESHVELGLNIPGALFEPKNMEALGEFAMKQLMGSMDVEVTLGEPERPGKVMPPGASPPAGMKPDSVSGSPDSSSSAATGSSDGFTTQVSLSREKPPGMIVSDDKKASVLFVTLSIGGQGVENAIAYGHLKVVEARDDQGMELTHVAPEFSMNDPSSQYVSGAALLGSAGKGRELDVKFMIDRPGKPARALEVLKGELKVKVAGSEVPAEFPGITGLVGRELEHPALAEAGVTARAVKPVGVNDESKAVSVAVQGPEEAIAAVDLYSPQGEKLNRSSSWSTVSGETTYILESEQPIPEDAVLRMQVNLGISEPIVPFAFTDLALPGVDAGTASAQPGEEAGSGGRMPEETKKGAGAGDKPAGGQPSRMLKAWTMDFTDAGIPEQPVQGEVRGEEFEVNESFIQNNVIVLRDVKYGAVRMEIQVSRFLAPGEKLGNSRYESENVLGVGISPIVLMRWRDPTKTRLQERGFFNDYAFRLELGEIKDGRIKGRLFVAVPDRHKSFVSGEFEAEVR